MLLPCPPHGGIQFIAIVTAKQGRYRASCFYEFPEPVPGFGAETETIYDGSAASLRRATTLVQTIAHERGFLPSEIVWG